MTQNSPDIPMSGLFASLTPATVGETFTVARVTKRKSGVYNPSDLASLGHPPFTQGRLL